MFDRLMGIETEYSIAAPGNGNAKCSPSALGRMLLSLARKRLPHVTGSCEYDLFLQNGSRLYLDCGRLPEFCTPEVDNPDDCIRYVLAGESILRDLAMELREAMSVTSTLTLSKTNVDYQPGVTWGCHENYLHRASLDSLSRQLTPHLVSRIYTCAGGLNPFCAGIEFSLSPRLHVFSEPTLECTISDGEVPPVRGIFNPRDDPMCRGGYKRLHVVCADSVHSQHALWLRVCTTWMVLAMAEAGLDPGGEVELRDPVEALRAYLTDPRFRATALLKSGRPVTAIELQRHYLEQAEKHLGHRCMPSFAPSVCESWRTMLDRLERGPESVTTTLDWALKHALFIDHVHRRGFDPMALPHWNHVLTTLHTAALKGGKDFFPSDAGILDSGLCQQERSQLAPYMREHGLSWDQLRPLLAVRDELCEIDMRFGQFAPEGLFDSLEPLLDHRILSVDQIGEAKEVPPQGTRARLRGNYIRRLARRAGCSADWDSISDERGRILYLGNPFAQRARWKKDKSLSPYPSCIASLYDAAYAEYERGYFERALGILESRPRRRGEAYPDRQHLSLFSWVQARRGHFQEAIQALDRYVTRNGCDDDAVRDYIVVYSFQAVGPSPSDPRRNEWIRRSDELLKSESCSPNRRAELLGHTGSILARIGSPEEAVRALLAACAIEEIEVLFPRMRARITAQLGDALRMLGRRDEAAHWLDKSELIHGQHEFFGERAAMLTCRAKLECDTDRARALLLDARRIQRHVSDYVGQVRTLLLEARLAPTERTATRRRKVIMALRERVPDLQTCPRLKEILERWNEWTSGVPSTRNGDFFWHI